MIAKLKFLLIGGLFLFGCRSNTPEPELHVYLCFGQSNMQGATPAEAQDSVVDAPDVEAGPLHGTQDPSGTALPGGRGTRR